MTISTNKLFKKISINDKFNFLNENVTYKHNLNQASSFTYENESSLEVLLENWNDNINKEELKSKLEYISNHDELTKLPNNICFKKELNIQCKNAQTINTKFALIMIDINGLKNIKYSLGVEFVNKIILEIAERIKSFLNKDTFISRNSDDNFAIILNGMFQEEYENIAKGLISLISKPFKIDNYELNVTSNIGICYYPMNAKDPDTLRKQCKIALMGAKKNGINNYKFYSSKLDIQNYKELIIRKDFHHAIENNQLRVYFQPIVDLETKEIIAAEALVRWEHPDWGILSPFEFIPIAEETGLIINVGKWIFREVCRNYKQWLTNGFPQIKISVNFSSFQFIENNFVENIKSTIDEFKLNPRFLIMEVTENALIKNAEKIISDIKRLQSFGIKVAIDNFGAKLSSLSYLYSFNIDILKLDSSIIKNIINDETCQIIARSIINLAKELKFNIVAEGIESMEQLFFLKGLNCFAGQGYIISHPVPINQFEKLLEMVNSKPMLISNSTSVPYVDKRKYFRISFNQLLQADLTVLSINGKSINVGNSKVLIKDLGPGGLSFLSNLRFPVEREVTLRFITELMNKEIKVYGHPVRKAEVDNNVFEYGVEFTLHEEERNELIKVLRQLEIKMKNDVLFADGRFISVLEEEYFNFFNEDIY